MCLCPQFTWPHLSNQVNLSAVNDKINWYFWSELAPTNCSVIWKHPQSNFIRSYLLEGHLRGHVILFVHVLGILRRTLSWVVIWTHPRRHFVVNSWLMTWLVYLPIMRSAYHSSKRCLGLVTSQPHWGDLLYSMSTKQPFYCQSLSCHASNIISLFPRKLSTFWTLLQKSSNFHFILFSCHQKTSTMRFDWAGLSFA